MNAIIKARLDQIERDRLLAELNARMDAMRILREHGLYAEAEALAKAGLNPERQVSMIVTNLWR